MPWQDLIDQVLEHPELIIDAWDAGLHVGEVLSNPVDDLLGHPGTGAAGEAYNHWVNEHFDPAHPLDALLHEVEHLIHSQDQHEPLPDHHDPGHDMTGIHEDSTYWDHYDHHDY